jgi:hypothetical protein
VSNEIKVFNSKTDIKFIKMKIQFFIASIKKVVMQKVVIKNVVNYLDVRIDKTASVIK